MISSISQVWRNSSGNPAEGIISTVRLFREISMFSIDVAFELGLEELERFWKEETGKGSKVSEEEGHSSWGVCMCSGLRGLRRRQRTLIGIFRNFLCILWAGGASVFFKQGVTWLKKSFNICSCSWPQRWILIWKTQKIFFFCLSFILFCSYSVSKAWISLAYYFREWFFRVHNFLNSFSLTLCLDKMHFALH